MCFLVKFMMERVLILMIMPTLLLASTTQEPTTHTDSSVTSNVISRSTPNCQCPTRSPEDRSPVLITKVSRVKVRWDKTNLCQGRIFLFVSSDVSKPLCSKSDILTIKLGKELCEERRCGPFHKFGYNDEDGGYLITANQTLIEENCITKLIECKDNNELLAYKVVTGLLVVLVLAVILFRFAWPTYTAFRKRFSHKRQNRWIGPTQSQSMSYHRGQGGNLKDDTVKRQSFPGLERLSVNPSREPSSNRNSDYDSYGYN